MWLPNTIFHPLAVGSTYPKKRDCLEAQTTPVDKNVTEGVAYDNTTNNRALKYTKGMESGSTGNLVSSLLY